MSVTEGGLVPETDGRQRPIGQIDDADAAALLAASRQLIAEARRLLADAPIDTSRPPSGPVLYRPLTDAKAPFTGSAAEPVQGFPWRLVGLVPAAAGVALLAAGLASLTGDHTDHGRLVQTQRPSPATALAPPPPNTAASSEGAAAFQIPLSVSVPRLHSDASVAGEVYVQTTGPEAGLLGAPSDYHQLGWYRHGDSGALVLDGHVGYRSDPGPLAFIGSLAPGDKVTVSFASGERAFQVTVVGRALKGQLPQQYFSDQYDQDLMLITCDYTSPFEAGHFLDNVYVVAAPVQ